MTTSKMIQVLKRACEKEGSQKAWAAKHGLSQAYVSDVLKGKRGAGESILRALGYEQEISYRKAST